MDVIWAYGKKAFVRFLDFEFYGEKSCIEVGACTLEVSHFNPGGD